MGQKGPSALLPSLLLATMICAAVLCQTLPPCLPAQDLASDVDTMPVSLDGRLVLWLSGVFVGPAPEFHKHRLLCNVPAEQCRSSSKPWAVGGTWSEAIADLKVLRPLRGRVLSLSIVGHV